MIRILVQIVVNAIGLLVAAEVIPGIVFSGSYSVLLLAGLVIGLVNLIVKPLVSFFSFPLIILSLGLFYLAINGLMFYLAAAFVPGFAVEGCLPAIIGGFIIAFLNWVLRAFSSD